MDLVVLVINMATIDFEVIGYEIRNANTYESLKYIDYQNRSRIKYWWKYYDFLGYNLDLIEITRSKNLKKSNYEGVTP